MTWLLPSRLHPVKVLPPPNLTTGWPQTSNTRALGAVSGWSWHHRLLSQFFLTDPPCSPSWPSSLINVPCSWLNSPLYTTDHYRFFCPYILRQQKYPNISGGGGCLLSSYLNYFFLPWGHLVAQTWSWLILSTWQDSPRRQTSKHEAAGHFVSAVRTGRESNATCLAFSLLFVLSGTPGQGGSFLSS